MTSIRFSIATVLLFTAAGFCYQQESTNEAPKFRSQTNLVLVPAQVRSKGQHVPGLKQESFTLLQDGKEQKIAVFEEVRTSTERLRRAPVATNQFTNELIGTPETARYTVIAIDRINTRTLDMQRLKQGLLKFLAETADTGEPIRLVAVEWRGIRLLHDFTTDPKALAQALEGANASPGKPFESSGGLNDSLKDMEAAILAGTTPDSDPKVLESFLRGLDNAKSAEQSLIAFEQRNTRINSLEALHQLAISLSGLPGRKSVVWASSGYPFSSIAREGRSSVTNDYGRVLEATSLDEYTTHLLSSANIAIYPVDARGTVNTAYQAIDPSIKNSPTASEKQYLQDTNQDIITTFEHLASGTGGKACVERTDLSGCFKDAMEDSRNYYMLGFYVDSKGLKDGWHKLQVKVEEKGTSVRTRTGFLYPLPDPVKTHNLDLSAAANSLLAEAGLPFRGEWTTFDPKGDKKSARFTLQVSPNANIIDMEQKKMNIEIIGMARAKDGSIAGQFAQKIDRALPPEAIATIQKGGITYKNAFDLAPGDYLVRFIVRDNLSGKIGGVSTLLKVP